MLDNEETDMKNVRSPHSRGLKVTHESFTAGSTAGGGQSPVKPK